MGTTHVEHTAEMVILKEINAKLDKLIAKAYPTGHTPFGQPDTGPNPPQPKIYAADVASWGGVEKFAKACRERMAGYPESVIGLEGAWDAEPLVIAFKTDYPQYFLR
jgi:hypothetical protein